MKTIDFYEIEQNPEIVEDVFQQLIGKNIEIAMQGSSISTIGILVDYIILSEDMLIELLFKDSPPCYFDYFLDGQMEIKFDDFLNKIKICYRKV
jgi:hypothetical protein